MIIYLCKQNRGERCEMISIIKRNPDIYEELFFLKQEGDVIYGGLVYPEEKTGAEKFDILENAEIDIDNNKLYWNGQIYEIKKRDVWTLSLEENKKELEMIVDRLRWEYTYHFQSKASVKYEIHCLKENGGFEDLLHSKKERHKAIKLLQSMEEGVVVNIITNYANPKCYDPYDISTSYIRIFRYKNEWIASTISIDGDQQGNYPFDDGYGYSKIDSLSKSVLENKFLKLYTITVYQSKDIISSISCEEMGDEDTFICLPQNHREEIDSLIDKKFIKISDEEIQELICKLETECIFVYTSI